jgi:hypothetical protein
LLAPPPGLHPAGACITAHAQGKQEEKKEEGGDSSSGKTQCKTALDLIASQNMNLPLHPVFQNILNSPDLKGTIFIPTTKAWDKFFATMRQRQGNPAAPAMVARYGQVLLYHLAKVRVVGGQPAWGADLARS